jgi:hydrogenase maturation protein HypF
MQLAAEELERAGFEVCLSERIPCNDGGLAFGQLAEVSARLAVPRLERGTG